MHSNLIRFGMPEHGVTTYFDAFDHVFNCMDTIGRPNIYFFIHSSAYIPPQSNTSVSMGAVEFVRKHPVHTEHGIQYNHSRYPHAKHRLKHRCVRGKCFRL